MAWVKNYVRARHYSPVAGAWTTRDPLWPSQMPFGYIKGMPTRATDPSGMQGKSQTSILNKNCGDKKGKDFESMCEKVRKCLSNQTCLGKLFDCVGGVPRPFFNRLMDELRWLCDDGTPNPSFMGPPMPKMKVCVYCHDQLPQSVQKECSCKGLDGFTARPFASSPIFGGETPPYDEKDFKDLTTCIGAIPYRECETAILEAIINGQMDATMLSGCDAKVILCGNSGPQTLLHELIHVLGVGRGTGHGKKKTEFTDRLEPCMKKIILDQRE